MRANLIDCQNAINLIRIVSAVTGKNVTQIRAVKHLPGHTNHC